CHTWRAVRQLPDLNRPLAAKSRVLLRDGKRIEITAGRVTHDSVTGTSSDGRVALPRDSVLRLEERRLDWRRPLGVAGLVVGVYIGAAVLISGPEALRMK